MATASTGQVTTYCPYVSLEVTASSSTGGSGTYAWTLKYNTVSGYTLSTSVTYRVVAKINGSSVYDAYVSVGSKTTFTIATGTKTISKTTSSQTITAEVTAYWGSAVWSGISMGTQTGSTSFTLAAKTSYTITFNANGGSGAPSSQTKWYDTALTLSSTKPTRSYYTFSKWNTTSGGTGTSYSSGGSYTANAAATLYAIWTGNTYTITYNANGGSNAPSSTSKIYGSTGTITTAVPTRTNYNFLGWATSSSSTTVTYKSGATLSATSITASTTLYAVWELAHTAPTISGLSAFRCDSSGNALNTGSYASVSFSWVTYDSYTASNLTVTGSSSTSISVSGTSGSVSKKVIAVSANETTITVTLKDSASTSATATFKLAAAYTFLFGFTEDGTGAAFFKIPEVSHMIEMGKRLLFPNGINIYGTDTDGTKVIALEPSNSSGNTTIGYGHYSNGSGNTNIYGNDVNISSASAGKTGFRPYFRAGDSITLTVYTAGYVTNSSASIYFTIPLARYILGSPTITVTTGNGFMLRENGSYTHGSSTSTYVAPSSYSATRSNNMGILVVATFSTTTNAVNNAPIGISWNGTITFS